MTTGWATKSRVNAVRQCLIAAAIALVLAVVLIPTFQTSSALADQNSNRTTVRVGYFSNGDFMHKAADGTIEGYDIEYYYMLASYADWDIQFVEYPNLDSALAGLESGDIDIMSGLSITEERSSKFLISSQKMSTAHIAVQTRSDDDRFAIGDTSTMTDMTCGILAGSNVVTLYTDWCTSNGLTPHVVEYSTIEQRNAALASGEVDAIAGGSSVAGAQKIAEFPSLDLYFMLNSNRSDLKTQLDRAMNILALQNPTFSITLYEKYFPSTKNATPSFSSAEKSFISSHQTIKVAVLQNDAPFSSVASDGTVSGILPDYFDHLSGVIGTKFECVPYASRDDACAAMAAGEVDMIGKFEDNVFLSNENNVILTIPFINMNMVQITRVGTDDVTSAAVPSCNYEAVEKTITDQDSNVVLTEYTNSQECFDAMNAGDVDSVICTQPAATWLLYRSRASNYVVLAFGSSTWNASCALSFGADGNTLRSILDKTITVDDGYINQIITNRTLDDSANLLTALERIPIPVLIAAAVIAIILLVLVIIALIIIIRRRKSERILAQQRAELETAEKINKARHDFFGTLSHDMRTPLNGINGFVDLALRSDDSTMVNDYLKKIGKSSAILSGLVEDMLIMSRMENGKYTIKPTPNDASSLFDEVLDPIHMMAEEKNVRFANDLSQLQSRYIMVDRLSLQKVVLNLLSNAIKFTPAGGTVHLDCKLAAGTDSYLNMTILVSDMGPGISEEFLPHIFEPFSQEDSDNAAALGSGMGLAIVKSIVDAMGGTINVDTKQGEGTVFTVHLSFEQVEPSSVLSDAGDVDTSILAGKRMLVCEDNELNLEIIRNILERCGIEVIGKPNGQLGLETFETSEQGYFDAILLDLRMPVMDGKSAARAIRSLPREDAKRVPIIAVSADAFAHDVQECADAGMDGHVSKPIDPQKLYGVLVEMISESQL